VLTVASSLAAVTARKSRNGLHPQLPRIFLSLMSL
jgi:hypothetical protein